MRVEVGARGRSRREDSLLLGDAGGAGDGEGAAGGEGGGVVGGGGRRGCVWGVRG